MSSRIMKPLDALCATASGCSLIKPHLKNLSGSRTRLDGIIVERDVERPNSGIYHPTGHAPQHIVVLHSAHPATLEWRMNGRSEEAFYRWGGHHQSGRAVCGAPLESGG